MMRVRSHDNLIRNERGLLIGYTCRLCNSYNDITKHGDCWNCQVYNDNLDSITITLSYAVRLLRTGEFIHMANNEVIELHAKFFNAEKVIIRELDEAAKSERRETLRQIIFEAKAKLSAHDEDEREKNAKLAKDKKDWLLTSKSNDPLVSDAIAGVKERKKRMTEADKLHAKLSSIGIAGPELEAIIAQAVRNNTGSAVSSSTSRQIIDRRESPLSDNCKKNLHKGCTGFRSFKEADGTEVENQKPCECKCHKPKVVFDPNAVSFKKKE